MLESFGNMKITLIFVPGFENEANRPDGFPELKTQKENGKNDCKNRKKR